MGKGDPKARLRELADALKTADFSSDAALEQAVHARWPRTVSVSAITSTPAGWRFRGPALVRVLWTSAVLGRERVLRRIERLLAT